MEAQIESHQWSRRLPDWRAAVVAGLAAGAVLMVLELLWAASLGDVSPWVVSRKIAALLMGPAALQDSGFGSGVMALALLTHYALGVFSGVAVAVVIAGFHWETSLGVVQIIGAWLGAAIYFVNFYLLAQVFPWFSDLRGWAALIGHLAFGMSAAVIYWKLSSTEAAG